MIVTPHLRECQVVMKSQALMLLSLRWQFIPPGIAETIEKKWLLPIAHIIMACLCHILSFRVHNARILPNTGGEWEFRVTWLLILKIITPSTDLQRFYSQQ